ncbi:uncharacterized protein (UPF0335 family) [Croceifilum oryzae]|uniref:Protein argonaute n=1 Tax=Croceifilum oryzae TaxID=1553429 RepID=A0AAJ1TGV0_9BACL|nr:Piwi domain-containing protein [Croceifilum oryzae]MDQ0418623.1 uncharacterized protein (UPF0335 family) [Croceifilum oryzae]
MRYILTDWKLDSTIHDFPLYLYNHPVRQEEVESANGQVTYDLRKANDFQPINFYQNWIASSQSIQHQEPYSFTQSEHRVIDPTRENERKLLERVLLSDLAHQCRDFTYFDNRTLIWKDPIETIGEYEGREGLKLSCLVDRSGTIQIGFDYTVRYTSTRTLEDYIRNGANLEEECYVIDRNTHTRYEFLRIDKRTYRDIFEKELQGQTLFQYYKNNNRSYVMKGKNPEMRAILVRGTNNKKYVYPQHLLRPEIDYSRIEKERADINRKTKQRTRSLSKLGAHDKMTKSLRLIEIVMQKGKLSYSQKGLLASELGYEQEVLLPPTLLFGNKKTILVNSKKVGSSITNGLRTGGVVHSNKQLHYRLVVQGRTNSSTKDQLLETHITIDKWRKHLEELSKKWGITLIKEKGKAVNLEWNDHKTLDYMTKLADEEVIATKELLENKQKDTPIIPLVVLPSDSRKNHGFHLKRNYMNQPNIYRILKKELGKKTIFSQVTTMDSIEEYRSDSLRPKNPLYYHGNILLGMYAKAGIQPWLLNASLTSDAYIGLDVSREDGKNASGSVQVVSQYGSIVSCEPVGSSERGEVISKETIETIISQVKRFYDEQKRRLRHITIYRDGKGHTAEMQVFKDILGKRGITFDYLSIVKKPNRRMAIEEDGTYRTEIGLTYFSEETGIGYLTATSPHDSVGMAEPIRIERKLGNTSMKQIMQDAYHLTFMQIHTLNKGRLPAPIAYADASSTFYLRGQLPSNGIKNRLPFV